MKPIPTTILALDLGKFNTVLCWYEPATRAATFRSVRTEPEELRRELLRQPGVTVVCEACSQAGWVHDLAGELGLAIPGPQAPRPLLGDPQDGPALAGAGRRVRPTGDGFE